MLAITLPDAARVAIGPSDGANRPVANDGAARVKMRCSSVACGLASIARVHSASSSTPRSTDSRYRASAASGTTKNCSGSNPRLRLVSACCSAPRASECALEVPASRLP